MKELQPVLIFISTERNRQPVNIDYLFLTHAHIDHIGRVPDIIDVGFKGEIICTHADQNTLVNWVRSMPKPPDKSVWFMGNPLPAKLYLDINEAISCCKKT